MIKATVFYIVFLVVMALVEFTGCSQDKILSDTERAAVLVFSEAATDNLFAGLTTNDYAVFSRDFDSYMKKRISATSFPGWRQDLNNQLGTYLSRQVDQISQSDEFYVVVYQAKFEQVEPILVVVAFHAAEPHRINNLWFDSEKLQQK